MSLLNIRNLTVCDRRTDEILIKDIHFEIDSNTCLGMVGESGSGKSVTCKAILGLANPWLEVTGQVLFEGSNLLNANQETLRQIRGKRICMILQDAMTAFDPLYTIGYQMVETLCENGQYNKTDAKIIAMETLQKMYIHEPRLVLKKYAHQLSGGMLQRCMIALAMALKPDILIADEPTTALDAINQREVIEEFQRLRQITGMAMIFISHDLGVVQHLAEKILVMKDGEQVEYGPIEQVFGKPQHVYTRYLLDTRKALTKSFHEAMKVRRSKEC